MPPKTQKTKETASTSQGFFSSCNIPLWDEAAIAQENWGPHLSGQGGAPSKGKGSKEPTSPTNFGDSEGNAILENFIAAHYTFGGIEAGASNFKVSWEKPEDIVKPFRPVVHRNTTPFLEPYAAAEDLRPLRSMADAELVAETSMAKSAPANSKKTAAKDQVVSEISIHEKHPEIVTFLDEMVPQDAEHWQNVERTEVIQQYRGLPTLMEPYDPTLTLGCAETPAEACGSRYSTALRHKLQRAEALSKLKSVPPFLMSSFNSALLLVESAQELIPEGQYLWELIYPHAPGTHHPVYNPSGKYMVKLFVEGAWRKVRIDDKLPVDELGRPLLTISSLKELWPALLAKALIKCFKGEAGSVFFEAPELLISCFTGNWMPHYYSFHPKEAVSVTAVLVKYMKQLADKSEKRRNSIQEKSATAEGSVENDDGGESGVPLPAKEVDFCQLISALRMPEKSSVASPGLNSGSQLFSIADIAPLRNTLAIHVQTTPKTDIQEGFFQRERNAADVVEILSRSGGSASAIPTDKENSVTSVWLTVEELCEQMNFLVLFRCLDGLYQNTAVVEYESTGGSAQEATSGASGKKSSSGVGAPETAEGVSGVHERVVWVNVECEKEEELTTVIYSRGTATLDGSALTTEGSDGEITSETKAAPVSLVNEIYIDHYQWDRAQPLSRAVNMRYNQGRRSATVSLLPKGCHTFRVTIPRMTRGDSIAFLTNATVQVKNNVGEFSKQGSVHTVVDADYYASFDPSKGEQVLFKRKLKVTGPTRVTVLLNGFPADVDPSTLRSIPMASASKGKPAGGAPTGSKTQRKSSSDIQTNAGDAVGEAPIGDFDETEFLANVSLVLVDLETGAVLTKGEMGRLMQYEITNNDGKGILLMACTKSFKRKSGLVLSPRKSALPKGVWQATVRSDNELAAFESIPHSATVIKNSGKLSRGGSHILFSHAFGVTEQAHLTLSCRIVDAFQIPFNVVITRLTGNYNTLTLTNGGSSFYESHREDIVYESVGNMGAVFLPDLSLDAGEKGKNCYFVVEGTIPKEKSIEWDEYMRHSLEMKFFSQRKATEIQMEEKRANHLRDIESDPQGYEQRRKEEMSAEQQLLQQEQAESRQRENPAASVSKRRRPSQDKKKGSVSRRLSADGGMQQWSPRSSSNPQLGDDSLDVQYYFTLQLSAAKVENKSILANEDCLTTVRQQWRQTLQFIQDKTTDASAATTPAAAGTQARAGSAGVSQGSGKTSKQQQAAAAAEEIQRQERGRQSRKQFLNNPTNVFLPFVEAVDEEKVVEKTRTNSRRHTSNAALQTFTIVTQDPEDGEQRHAAPLAPQEYRVRLLPLREVEVVEAVAVTSPVMPSSSAGGRDKKGKGKTSVTASSSVSPTASHAAVYAEMEQGEEREKTTKFQQELKTLSEGIHDDTSLVLADLQKCNAPFLNKVVQSRWEAIGTTEEPLVFSSVLGHAPEDGHTKRQKSVSHS